jgi:hypothetical protein
MLWWIYDVSILILTLPGDHHAHSIRWAVHKLGGDVRILYPFDICASSQWSIDPDKDELWIESLESRLAVRRCEYDTVWMRRPAGVLPLSNISDMVQRAVAEDELRAFVSGVLCWLEIGKFVINPIQATGAASQKSFQLPIAAEMGLNGPRTLLSNSPEDILAFFDACGGEFVYKPLRPALWTLESGDKTIVPTTLIRDRSILLESDLRSAPGIYQEKIIKRAEIRATFMGRSVFAWEKRFENRPHAQLDIDWRAMNDGADLNIHHLPDDIQEKCFRLLSALGLYYGAFDFAIDENGEYQFLEVNPQGQFLWGDQLGLGMNQLEAFAEFLLSGDPEFRYSNSNRFNLDEYHQSGAYEDDLLEERSLHDGGLLEYDYKLVSLAL